MEAALLDEYECMREAIERTLDENTERSGAERPAGAPSSAAFYQGTNK